MFDIKCGLVITFDVQFTMIGSMFYDGILTGVRYSKLLQNVMPNFLEFFVLSEECIVSTRRRACSQDISSEAVSRQGIIE